MAVEDSKDESQSHENSTEPDGAFGEDIGGLGAKDRVGKVASKSGAETLRARFLHEDKEGEKDANQKVDPEQDING